MNYNILVKTGAAKPIPGATVTFTRAGSVLTSLTTGANGIVTINDETDGGLLGEGVLAVASAPGYYDLGIAASQITANWYFELTPKPKTMLYIAGGAVAALLLTGAAAGKKKKVSGYWDNLDPRVKTGAFIVGGIGVFYLLQKLVSSGTNSSDLPASTGSQLEVLASQGIYPTINDVQAEAFASQLRAAFDDCGTNEQSVYSVMQQMSNIADVYKVITVYGTRGYKGCFDGDYFSNHAFNLSEALTNELGSSELAKVNSILAANGIAFNF